MRRGNSLSQKRLASLDVPDTTSRRRPAETLDRARNVVTRSGKTFRGKFPSRKCGRSIHWESLNERNAIRWFEYHPAVASYREQPSVETYYDDCLQPRQYFPDFEVVLRNEIVIHVEVKPARRLARQAVKEKYALIAMHYSNQHRHFRILTDQDLRMEPMHSNVRLLRHYSKNKLPKTEVVDCLAALAGAQSWSFDDAARRIGLTPLLRLIAGGFLFVNINAPMEGSSRVWAKDGEETDHDAFCL